MTLSSSEADVIIRDLTDYNLVLKLYEARKGEIKTLETIRVKQDSLIVSQAQIIALREQKLASLQMEAQKLSDQLEGKDKKIRNKNRTIAGLVGLQLLEIGLVIALITI